MPKYSDYRLEMTHQRIAQLMEMLGYATDGLRVEDANHYYYHKVLLGGRELFLFSFKNGTIRLFDDAVFLPDKGLLTDYDGKTRLATFREVLQEAIEGKHNAPDWLRVRRG